MRGAAARWSSRARAKPDREQTPTLCAVYRPLAGARRAGRAQARHIGRLRLFSDRRVGQRRARIATFNVNGVNGRLPRLLEWLAETAPDIVPAEIKTGDATFRAAAIEAAGYRALRHGQRARHGVAILARGEATIESVAICPAIPATCAPGIALCCRRDEFAPLDAPSVAGGAP
jgi:hypothetical protein